MHFNTFSVRIVLVRKCDQKTLSVDGLNYEPSNSHIRVAKIEKKVSAEVTQAFYHKHLQEMSLSQMLLDTYRP